MLKKLAATGILLLFACSAHAEEFGRLTVQEVAQKRTQKNFYVFDNNENGRYLKSHVPGAKWVNPYALAAQDLPADKTATLVFYCASEH